MLQFAEQFSDFEIVGPLARNLSWSHFLILLPLKSMEAKLYYAKNCAEQKWGKRELREQINRKAFERVEIGNKDLLNKPKPAKECICSALFVLCQRNQSQTNNNIKWLKKKPQNIWKNRINVVTL